MTRPSNTLVLVAALTLLFGCTPSAEDTAAEGSDGDDDVVVENPKGVVGVTVMNLTNPFFTIIAKNLKRELARAGYEMMLVSAEEDPAKQQSQVKDFIVKRVAAIVINPKDSKAIGPAIVDANAADIPVFTVDVKCLDPTAKVVAHIGTDNIGGGRLAGKAMIEALGEDGGKIAVLDHNMVESCIERVNGFLEVVNAYNEGRTTGRIEVVTTLPSGGARDVGFRSTEDAMQAHPDIAGIFAINDPSALGSRAALEKAGKQDAVKVIGFDGQREAKKAIRDGKLYASPIQYPDLMGVKTAKSILDYFEGKSVEAVQDIATTLYRKADGEKDPDLD